MVGFDVRNVKEDDFKKIKKLNSSIDFLNLYSSSKKNNCKVIVAQLNDDIVGYVKFLVLNGTKNKDIISIEEILVDKMYRGLGIGYQLMIEVEKNIKYYKASSLVKINDKYLEEERIFLNRQGFDLNSDRIYEKKYYN